MQSPPGRDRPRPSILLPVAAVLGSVPAILCLLLLAPKAPAQSVLVEEYRFGDFVSAEALSVDPFGDIYVADAGASMVQKFDRTGKLLAEVGGAGWEQTQFDRPLGVDASLGMAVYVADMGNNRISRFDRGLRFMAQLSGDDGAADPGFRYPLDVVNSPLEQMYILDGENNRVLAMTGFNRSSSVFGGIEAGEGRLTQPVAMGMGGERLYVLETDRVVTFDLFGNFLFHFGSNRFSDAQGIAMLPRHVLVVSPDALHWFTPAGDFVRSVQREDIVLAGETGAFRDAAYTSPFLLLLTNRSCILFPDH
ncbi:MAG: hypothetical protein JXA28_14725 [Bacteroidetes bacterium]|nr:hypothetical protein [Bacteroidota bacterium]